MPAFSHPMGEEILTVNNPSKPLYHKGFRDFEMIEFHGFRSYLPLFCKLFGIDLKLYVHT